MQQKKTINHTTENIFDRCIQKLDLSIHDNCPYGNELHKQMYYIINQYIEGQKINLDFINDFINIFQTSFLPQRDITNWIDYVNKFFTQIYSVHKFDMILCFFNNTDKEVIECYAFHASPIKNKKEQTKINHYLQNLILKDKKKWGEYLPYSKTIQPRQIKQKKIKIFFQNMNLDNTHLITLQDIKMYPFNIQNPSFEGLFKLVIGVDRKRTNVSQSFLNFISILSSIIVSSSKALTKLFEHIQTQAFSDPLTKLYNRQLFEDRVTQLISSFMEEKDDKNKFSIIYIDVDNFKQINDTYGHPFGDKYLIHLANILKNNLRKYDNPARIGGDEFAVLLPNTKLNEAKQIVNTIMEQFKTNKIMADFGSDIQIQASFAIVEFPTHGTTKEEIIESVDGALYYIKRKMKGKLYIPESNELFLYYKNKKRQKVLIDEALYHKQIIPFIQPIMNLKSREIYAYEVLIKLKDKNGVLKAAKDFIEVAEETGDILNIGLYNIQNALNIYKEKNMQEKLFINFSVKEIKNQGYINKVLDIINNNQIDPAKICFEIIERDAIKSLDDIKNFIDICHNAGVNLAIDDFGSGYAIFSYLKHIPVDYVKIDGDYIKDIMHNEFDEVFVECVKKMADTLNMKVIAEFIEDGNTMEKVHRLDDSKNI